MHALTVFGISELQAATLLFFTLSSIAVAQVHSFRTAYAAVRESRASMKNWRALGALFLRHEREYLTRVPMLILFILSAVVIVAGV